jgi:hypothetical protein
MRPATEATQAIGIVVRASRSRAGASRIGRSSGATGIRVKGPIVEGIIQQNEGPAFDLKPEDFIELPELLHKAVPDRAIPKDACPLRLVADTRVWSICEHHGDPLLVFLQAFVPPPPMRDCVDPQGPLFSGTGIDA